METDNHIIHTVDSVIVHMHQLACGLKGSSGADTHMYSYPHVHMYSYLHVQLLTCTATYMYKALSPGQEIVITRVVYGQWRLI